MDKDVFNGDVVSNAAKFFFKRQYVKNYFKGFNFNKLKDRKSAIYVLFAEDEDGSTYCLYVGESSDVKRRLKDHLRKYQIVDIKIFPFVKKLTKPQRLHYERMFINIYKPRLNLKNTQVDVFGKEISLKKTDVDIDNYEQYTLDQLKKF